MRFVKWRVERAVDDWVIIVTDCCPRTVRFSEMRSKKWIQLAILCGFGPDNEYQVAFVCEMLSNTETDFGQV